MRITLTFALTRSHMQCFLANLKWRNVQIVVPKKLQHLKFWIFREKKRLIEKHTNNQEPEYAGFVFFHLSNILGNYFETGDKKSRDTVCKAHIQLQSNFYSKKVPMAETRGTPNRSFFNRKCQIINRKGSPHFCCVRVQSIHYIFRYSHLTQTSH